MKVEIISAVIAAIASITGSLLALLPKIKAQKNRIKLNENRLSKNEEALNTILLFKPGLIPYTLLEEIKNQNEKLIYNNSDENLKRCLNHLLDDGYLMPAVKGIPVEFSDKTDRVTVYRMAKTTPMADNLISFRNKINKKPNGNPGKM